MSLTGIALAIGVIVDNGIIMAENAYKNLAVRQAELTTEADNATGNESPPAVNGNSRAEPTNGQSANLPKPQPTPQNGN